MSSEAANSSHCAEETAWSLLVHNSEADQQKTHQIWSPDNSINSNNGDVKPLYNVPTREYSHGAQRMAKEECGSNVELNSPDLDGVKSSMIQDGDQTLTLYDLNQNHEAKVTVVMSSQTSCSTSSVASFEEPESSNSHSTSSESHHHHLSPCVVCGDKSSGKHYGQLTCEGCKSFFKRSVRKNITYTCRGNRDCSVDPQHRNQCQYCRLRKCIKSGMRREAVQRGRVNPTSPLEYYQQQSSMAPLDHNSRLNACYMSNFVTVLLRAEPYPISHMQGPQPLGAHLAMDSLCELAARLLFSAVEWARNIPFFTEMPLIDQVSLLRSSWSELFILNTAQCCPPVYVSSILSATYHPPPATSSDARFHHSYTQEQSKLIQDQLERFTIIRLDPAEFSCLKALCLFSPDVPGLHDPATVQSIQEKTYSSFEEYDRVQYNNQPGRTGRLLLRLPALKLINPAAVENLFFIKLIGKTPIETLIRDMLLGGSSFCWPTSVDHPNNAFVR